MKKLSDGLLILLKYDVNGSFAVDCGVIYMGGGSPLYMEEVDVQKLHNLGWVWLKTQESWVLF